MDKETILPKTEPMKVILYDFYRKTMACRTPIHQRSANPEKDKVQTVANEFQRRFRNSSRDLPSTAIEKVVKEYVKDSKRGGFLEGWIQNVLDAACTGYMRQITREIQGECPIKRPASYGRKKKLVKRLVGKATWFQSKPKDQNDPKTTPYARSNREKARKNRTKP